MAGPGLFFRNSSVEALGVGALLLPPDEAPEGIGGGDLNEREMDLGPADPVWARGGMLGIEGEFPC